MRLEKLSREAWYDDLVQKIHITKAFFFIYNIFYQVKAFY
jgi:hypothetical protein